MSSDPSRDASAALNMARLRVRALMNQADEIDRYLRKAVEEAWPVGSSVCWIKTGRNPALGRVVATGWGRLKVRNDYTGKEVSITPFHIFEVSRRAVANRAEGAR